MTYPCWKCARESEQLVICPNCYAREKEAMILNEQALSGNGTMTDESK